MTLDANNKKRRVTERMEMMSRMFFAGGRRRVERAQGESQEGNATREMLAKRAVNGSNPLEEQ